MIVNLDKLSRWLNEELNKRGWSQSELSRRSGVSNSAISRTINGEVEPTLQFCRAIARPLERTPAEVMILGGLITRREARVDDEWLKSALGESPAESRLSPEMSFSEVVSALRDLEPAARGEILSYILWRSRRQSDKNTPSPESPTLGG